MNIVPHYLSTREAQEQALSPIATRSQDATRQRPQEPDPFRTPFEQDRDAILHSKAFRRLANKTQVFVLPEGDHTINRLTHTLQVAQVARSLAVAMGLNEQLTEAIALAHDVGHTPFGHTGEYVLSEFFEEDWIHAHQSLRIYDVLEPINLTDQTRDGIMRHPWRVTPEPSTPEAHCVRYADRVAYLTHDALDAIRADILTPTSLPGRVLDRFGPPGPGWIGQMIHTIVSCSSQAGRVCMDEETFSVFDELRDFMFANVYTSPAQREVSEAAGHIVRSLVEWYNAHPEHIPLTYSDHESTQMRRVADYVSGMTDRFALTMYIERFGSDAHTAVLGFV